MSRIVASTQDAARRHVNVTRLEKHQKRDCAPAAVRKQWTWSLFSVTSHL